MLHRAQLKILFFVFQKDINPQINNLCEDYHVCDVNDVASVVSYSKKKEIDLVIVGPENPLAGGVVNALEQAGISCVGPKKEVAMIETSKSFARMIVDLCCPEKNPQRKEFVSIEGVKSFMETLEGKYVIKFDGPYGRKRCARFR